MNWLLHQLQKVLGAIGGRRSNSRPFSSSQDASNTAPTKESGSAIADTPTASQADISFSIQPVASTDQQPTASQKDAIQRAIEKAENAADTHMRLDAASSAVPGSQSELSDSEVRLSAQWMSNESATDFQSADQLPSIHDLLPAVEQEIKENSAYLDEEAILAASDSAVADSVSVALENYDLDEVDAAEGDLDEIAEPVQALLFSFDIIESAPDEENSIEDGDTAEPVQPSALPLEPVKEETLLEIAIAPLTAEDIAETSDRPDEQALVDDVATELDAEDEAIAPSSKNHTDLLPESEAPPLDKLERTEEVAPENALDSSSNASDFTVFDRASLPYPWSIATPKKTAPSKDKPVLQQEDAAQTRIQPEKDSTTEQALAYSPSPDSTSTQSSTPLTQATNHPTKNGVVKLLFTMKEGNFHGYIEPQDGTSDILFHQKYINEDIFASLERGVEVVVSVEYKEGKAYATQVELA